jgi:hypothetical protein
MLRALLRGARVARGRPPLLEELLPKITVGDGRRHDYVSDAETVLLNPPYGRVATPPEIDWTSGLVTDAALWTAAVVGQAQPDARVVAVLPDVLRSGSRYARWRSEIAAQAQIDEVRSIGQFDALTDVDVFVLSVRRSTREPGREWPRWESAGATLGDVCSIMVGPVVDLRDEHKGPSVPYVTTNVLPQTGEVVPDHRRRFAKRLFQPPFVVVRRTSRPTVQEARLRPVIVRGSEPIAVENHLLVLKPARPTLKACRALVEILADQQTTDWLNRRIRTRHLTVSALSEVPLSAEASRFRSR